jgi:hypothetical protein
LKAEPLDPVSKDAGPQRINCNYGLKLWETIRDQEPAAQGLAGVCPESFDAVQKLVKKTAYDNGETVVVGEYRTKTGLLRKFLIGPVTDLLVLKV